MPELYIKTQERHKSADDGEVHSGWIRASAVLLRGLERRRQREENEPKSKVEDRR